VTFNSEIISRGIHKLTSAFHKQASVGVINIFVVCLYPKA